MSFDLNPKASNGETLNQILQKLKTLSEAFREIQADRGELLGPLVFSCAGFGRRPGCSRLGRGGSLALCPDRAGRSNERCNCCDSCRDYCQTNFEHEQQEDSR